MRRSRGFTLIEILVVVVIIAVMVSMVVLSIGVAGEDRELDAETEQFTRAAEVALEQAQLEGRDYGFRYSQESWEVRIYDGRTGVWRAVPNDRLLETHPLPEGLLQRLEVEGRIVLLKPQAKLVDVDAPQVMAFGGGEWQPFRWTLERPKVGTAVARTVVIEGKPDGTLSVVRSGAAQ